MERRSTLKQFITLQVFLISAIFAQSQNYNNIEFIENKGQWDARVKYKGDVSGGAFYIRSGGFTVLQNNQQDYEKLHAMFHGDQQSSRKNTLKNVTLRSHSYNVDFVGFSADMQVVPEKVLHTYNNYFIGNDPSKWAGECHIYQAITLKNVYPGIDVRYYTDRGTLKYDIVAKPGSDISKIALKYEGADKLQIKNKELIISTSVGDMKESTPYSYQLDGKERKTVSCKYTVENNIVRFDIKNYDRDQILVIDPFQTFCSFTGSPVDNWGFTATYGPDGSMYGGGIVFAPGFPVSPGAFQTTYGGGAPGGFEGGFDIGVMKLSPDESNRVYATYIGGTGNEMPQSLIVDPQGELIVAGRSSSGNYPLKPASNAIGSGGGFDIVVTKLNAAGGLLGSIKIGGSGDDGANITNYGGGANSLQQNYGDEARSEVNIDGSGNIYLASCTKSAADASGNGGFPVVGGFQSTNGGNQDGVVLKFTPDLSTILFSTYLGGNGNDAAYVLSINPNNGDIYVAGGTESSAATFPGNHAGTIGPSNNGGIDGFVAQISSNGSTLIRSTFLGTTGTDQVYGIQFDKNGFPYVMGQTTGAWNHTNATYFINGAKQFISKLEPDLSAYIYSTTFGTPAVVPNISPVAFLVDRCENVYVSGWGGRGNTIQTYESAGTTGMSTTADAGQSTTDGSDFYFFVLKRDAVSQLYGSFFGQNGGNYPDHVDGGTSRFDRNGVIYQAICGNCGGGAVFPTTPGVWTFTKPPSALCNLAMLKISFNLAGVGATVESAIGGVPRDTAGCLPLTVVFTDQIRNAVQYIWNYGDATGDFGPMDADTGYTQPHTFYNTGTYTVMLIAIDPASCNIRDTSYIRIRVGDLKAFLDFSFIKLDPCEQFNYRFHNLSVTDLSRPFTNLSFSWDFGDGSPQVVAGMNDVDHVFPHVGPYTVKLILHDTAYCNDPDSIPHLVRVADNVAARFETPPTGCAPYSAGFTNTSNGGLSFQWDFGDPSSGANNTSTADNPTHLYTIPGTYIITLVANDSNTCNKTSSTTFTIIVYEKPVAGYSYVPVTPVENTPVTFTNLSSAVANRFKWLFGDGDSLVTTSRADIQHQYNATKTFNACIVAFNAAGCSDTSCLPVRTIVIPALDVPNAFTPNSGNTNSTIFVRGFGIAKMHFIIWNRWGQKVFETNNRFDGWNGKVKGVVQPMDVYAYTLDVEFSDGTKTTKKGDITLIR